MLKKFLVEVLVAVLLCAAIGSGAGLFAVYKAYMIDKESAQFVDNALPKIASSWNVEDFYLYADPKSFPRENGGEEEAKKMFSVMASLGAVKQYHNAEGHAAAVVHFDFNEGIILTANYKARIDFEQGPTEIVLELVKKDGAWKIFGFHVNSPTLTVQPPAASAQPEPENAPVSSTSPVDSAPMQMGVTPILEAAPVVPATPATEVPPVQSQPEPTVAPTAKPAPAKPTAQHKNKAPQVPASMLHKPVSEGER